MRPPNLYFTKNGQRQCLKCKQILGREYRAANRERLKKQRKAKIEAKKAGVGRKPYQTQETVRQKIMKHGKAIGGTVIDGADV